MKRENLFIFLISGLLYNLEGHFQNRVKRTPKEFGVCYIGCGGAGKEFQSGNIFHNELVKAGIFMNRPERHMSGLPEGDRYNRMQICSLNKSCKVSFLVSNKSNTLSLTGVSDVLKNSFN